MKFLHSDSCKRLRLKAGVKFLLAAVCLFSGVALFAQPNSDMVPLFMGNNIGGTARSASMAGAYGSVGADLSSLDINPAGLGLYRSSDVCITPAINIAQNQSAYDGTNTNGSRPSFQMGQLGFAFTKLYGTPNANHDGMSFDSHPLRSLTFAINFQSDTYFNRLQNFGQPGTNNSLVNNFINYIPPGYTYEWAMLYYAGIINNNNNSNNYYSRMYGPVQQAGNILTRGGINKISLGLGGNVDDKIYFGFSLAVPILNYTTTPQMTETQINDTSAPVNYPNYNLSSTYNESGVGFTGNLGLIYKPVRWARIGVAYGLPTWYFLSETYSSALNFVEDSAGGPYQGTITTGDFDPAPQSFNYRIRTPMKGTVSTSFFLKDKGFISADYEFQNLGSTRYSFPDTTVMPAGSDTAYNHYLKSTYTFVHTIRVGIEGAVNIVRLHAGYSYSSTPFHAGQEFTPGYNGTVQNATCGIGIRTKHFYADLAYVFSYTKDALQSPTNYFGFQLPYDQINNRLMTHTISLTLGWKITRDNSPGKQRKRAAPLNNNYTPSPVDPVDRY